MTTGTHAAELLILGSVIEHCDLDLPSNLERLISCAPESFDDERHGAVAVAIRELRKAGKPADMVAVAKAIGTPDAAVLVSRACAEAMSLDLAEHASEPIWTAFRDRRAKSVFDDAQAALEQAPSQADAIIHNAVRSLESLSGKRQVSLSALLASRRINLAVPPPPRRTIYTLADVGISTPANLTSVLAPAKAGKTAVLGAMQAATMVAGNGADLLCFASSNPTGRAVASFDSEQSGDDAWSVNDLAVRRAGLTAPPPWLVSYYLSGLAYHQAWKLVLEGIRIAAEEHGGIHSIFLDGVADFVADVNDAAECNAFVSELHSLAITQDCPVIGVLHFNPGSEKARGHLGSQLERKAETNLVLEKDTDETTVIYSTKNRRAGIPKSTGPRFRYDQSAGMHVTVESHQSAKDTADSDTLREIALDVFDGKPAMRYSDILSTLTKRLGVSANTAERRLMRMRKLTIISKSAAGLYVINGE